MLKRAIILLLLALTVAAPFVLRPRQQVSLGADDTLVIITPHNEAIRHEFSVAFGRWYHERTGRTVALDWRMVGGTSEIARYLEGEYVASFRNVWTRQMGRPWSAEVQAGFQNPRLAADAPEAVRQARAAFLASQCTCGVDLFYGGGPYDFVRQARAGRLVNSGLRALHPDWFSPEVFPRTFGGEEYWDKNDLWYGAVLSCYGILYNRDCLARLGIEREPSQWSDLTDPRYLGQVGMCDPTKSGSIAAAFENVLQQQIQKRMQVLGDKPTPEQSAKAIRQGWLDGLHLLQLVGANARYFTDSSQKPPIDVAAGDCAAGMCIDFYGREQQEAVRRRGSQRLGYISPEGGSSYSVDPIGLLRGAPHAKVAVAFMEYVMSLEGQRLWNQKTGTQGGPETFALRRLPVRRDYYLQPGWGALRSDPEVDPYSQKAMLVHHDEWTGQLFSELAFIVRVTTEDTHDELVGAWKAILKAPEPRRSRALAVLQDLSRVDYDQALGPVKKGLTSKNQVDAVRLARDLGAAFREQYAQARRIALGDE